MVNGPTGPQGPQTAAELDALYRAEYGEPEPAPVAPPPLAGRLESARREQRCGSESDAELLVTGVPQEKSAPAGGEKPLATRINRRDAP